ncbi:hypothetical protein [Larkinella soli]|uniref:hypothetical protein n=1 Tax=Larkinella soli TaxID=1770527 RepID=UPI000FFCC498|nr:hypothetical protein [Larkinella soli]
MRRRFWIRRGLAIAAFALLFVTLAGLAVSGLWNWLVPSLFAGPAITFWQALGLLALARILVGFGGRPGGWGPRGGGWGGRYGHPRHAYWRQRMAERWQNMTPEERNQFKAQMKQQWREGCGRRDWHRGRPDESDPSEPDRPAEPTATRI